MTKFCAQRTHDSFKYSSRSRRRGGSPHARALLLLVVACSCAGANEHAVVGTSLKPTTTERLTSTGTAPHEPEPDTAATNDTRELAVSGFETAVIVVPPGERPVPLLVATHGAGGDPTWECERWGYVARGRWFLACPRGTALRRGEAGSYFYPDHPTLEREVMAVVAAVRAAFGARVATSNGVYVGYSQGATMGALMVVDHGALFPHLLLIEGGSGDWTQKRAAQFRENGGQSVFIVCGTEACAKRAAASAPVLERAGLHAVASYAEGAGHTELGAAGVRAEALLETLANTPK